MEDWRSIVVTEAIKPTPTEFGTDYKNEKFLPIETPEGFGYHTFFESPVGAHIISISANGVSGFGTMENKLSIMDLMRNPNLVKQGLLNQGFSQTIFNKFFFILTKAAEELGIDEFKIGAYNPDLERFYERLLTNKKLHDIVADYGFKFNGTGTFSGHGFNNVKTFNFIREGM